LRAGAAPIDRRKSPSFYYLSGVIQRKTKTTDEKPQQVRTDWGNRYLPKDIIAMNPLVGNTIKVFREASEWDKAEKLWQLPGEKRQELYVTTYTVPVDEDGGYQLNTGHFAVSGF